MSELIAPAQCEETPWEATTPGGFPGGKSFQLKSGADSDQEILIKTGALQTAIFNSANFSSLATDSSGVIQNFNVGAERMLGYTAAYVVNRNTPADISDPQEVV